MPWGKATAAEQPFCLRCHTACPRANSQSQGECLCLTGKPFARGPSPKACGQPLGCKPNHLAPGTWGQEPGNQGTRNQEPGFREPGTRDLGPRKQGACTSDEGPAYGTQGLYHTLSVGTGTKDWYQRPRPRTRDQGPRTKDQWPMAKIHRPAAEFGFRSHLAGQEKITLGDGGP